MIEPDDDITIDDVEEFFDNHGSDEVELYGLGPDWCTSISVDRLYEMFRARMRLEI